MEKFFGPVITTVKELASDVLSLNLKVLLPKSKMSCDKERFSIQTSKGGKVGQLIFNSFLEPTKTSMTANIVPIARNQQVQQLYKISVMGCHLKWSAVFPTASWVLEGTGNLLPGSWVWQDLTVLTSATFAIPQSKILKRANRTHPGTSTYFSQRTFQSICSDNEKFMNGGSVKSKANKLHNCESRPIFQTAGPVLHSLSCMPLHLSLGLGKQVLDLVTNEASSLDNSIKEKNGTASPELAEVFTSKQKPSKQQQLLDEAKEARNEIQD